MNSQIPKTQEKRQVGRVKIYEPLTCHVHVPKSQGLWVNQGIIRDVCLNGIYFMCDSQPPLDKNDINNLTFDISYNGHINYQLKIHALVVRTENKQPDCSHYGVALKFLSDPIYYSFKEDSQNEFPALDKIRILYQHYTLNKMAYEIIQRTPDVRVERINNIRDRIDNKLYKIEYRKLAHSLTYNLYKDSVDFLKDNKSTY